MQIFNYAGIRGYYTGESVLLIKRDTILRVNRKGVKVQKHNGSRFFQDIFLPLAKIIAYGYKGYFYMHTAVLKDEKGNIFMFPGNSGTGKTTISRTLIENGWRCLSDDSVLIRQKKGNRKFFFLIPFKNTIKVPENKRIKKIFLNARQKLIILFPEVKNVGTELSSSVGIQKLEPHENKTRILNISHVETMDLLVRSSAHMLTVPQFAQRHMRVLAELLNIARCYKIELARDMLRDKNILLERIGSLKNEI